MSFLGHSGFSYEEGSSCKHPRTVTEQPTINFLLREKQNPFPRAAPGNSLHGCCKGFGRNSAVVETILTQALLQAGAFAELLGNPSPRESGLQIGALCTKLLVLGLDVILAVFTVMLQGEAPNEGLVSGDTYLSRPTPLCARCVPMTCVRCSHCSWPPEVRPS